MKALILIFFGMILAAQISFISVQELDQNATNTQQPVDASIDRSSHHHPHTSPTFEGFWKKRFIWRPRWVKTWQENKIYVAVWKKMWGPAEVNEWVPVPKPPPGWIKRDTGAHFVKVGAPH